MPHRGVGPYGPEAKIVASLRSIFVIKAWYFQHENQKSVSEYNRIACFFLLIKSTEYLNFRHFSAI